MSIKKEIYQISDILFSASAILFSAFSRLLSTRFLGFISCNTGDSTTIICSKFVNCPFSSAPSGIRLRYRIDCPPLRGVFSDFCLVNSSRTRFLSFCVPLTSNIDPNPPLPIVRRAGFSRLLA